MIIKVINNNSFVLRNLSNIYTEKESNGNISLYFDISPEDEQYKLIAEETKLEYNNTYFLIKKINERKTTSSIVAELDLDDLKKEAYLEYKQTEQTLSNILDNALALTGWTHTNATLIAGRRTVNITKANTLDIINECSKLFNCVFAYDNKNKIITAIDYKAKQPTGSYFTDELNLKGLEYKGDSSVFTTRLYCYGKKENEADGYLTFASLNNGKEYIENHDYSDKLISAVWVDERYTDKQSLLDDAIEKLKILAYPKRSYTCKLTDLSKIDTKYSFLACGLNDVVTLIDRRKQTRINYQIVKIREYDASPLDNVYTLSTLTEKIEGIIKRVDDLVNNAGEIVINGTSLNEFKRDIDTNSLEISKRYTKGETDTEISSKIIQNNDNLLLQISENYVNENEYSTKITALEQSINSINANFSKTGFRNIIRNSAGINGLKDWIVTNEISTLNVESESGNGFLLDSVEGYVASMKQLLKLPEEEYTLKLKLRSIDALEADISVKLINAENEQEQALETFTINSVDFTPQSITFKPLFKNAYLVITNNSTHKVIITDLIIAKGCFILDWTQCEEELFTTNIKLSNEGIEVGTNTTEMKSKITPSAFEIYRGNEKRINVAPDGTKLQKTVIEDDLTIGTVKIIKRSNGADFIVL